MNFESVSYNNVTYTAKNILDSAVRANVFLEDIKAVSVVFEKSEEKGIQEKNGEIRE